MRHKDLREWQGFMLSDRVRAERIAVYFGVLNSKPPKFGKTASEEQNGGTWGFSLDPCLQELSSGQAAALIPPTSFPWEVRAMETAAGRWKPSWLCIHFWELGITLRHPCFGYSLSVYCPQIHCSFHLAFSCESLFQHLQPNNDSTGQVSSCYFFANGMPLASLRYP